jgi:alpha-tubulin suppressor-like RCC1 family protein
VRTWGLNEQGQLGYGHTDFVAAGQVPDEAGPVELGGPAVQVAAGGQHSCALLENGEVVCWGWNPGRVHRRRRGPRQPLRGAGDVRVPVASILLQGQ